MDWISVDESLPKNREQVLVLVLDYFATGDNPLCQKLSHRVFQGHFHRQRGWSVPFYANDPCVTYWMPMLDMPAHLDV